MALHITVELFSVFSFKPYPRGIRSNICDVKKIIRNLALFPKFRENKVVLTVNKEATLTIWHSKNKKKKIILEIYITISSLHKRWRCSFCHIDLRKIVNDAIFFFLCAITAGPAFITNIKNKILHFLENYNSKYCCHRFVE